MQSRRSQTLQRNLQPTSELPTISNTPLGRCGSAGRTSTRLRRRAEWRRLRSETEGAAIDPDSSSTARVEATATSATTRTPDRRKEGFARNVPDQRIRTPEI